MGGSILAFTLVALVVTVTPGLDTALVVRSTLRDGGAAGVDAALGVCTGLVVWGFATALGITVLFSASQTAYDVLRVAGAVWLVVLGVRTLRDARRSAHRASDVAEHDAAAPRTTRNRLGSYRTGLATNLLIVWLSLVAWLTSRARSVLGRGAWRRASERLTGVVLLGLGLRLAIERR